MSRQIKFPATNILLQTNIRRMPPLATAQLADIADFLNRIAQQLDGSWRWLSAWGALSSTAKKYVHPTNAASDLPALRAIIAASIG
jgi:hypothetical protein